MTDNTSLAAEVLTLETPTVELATFLAGELEAREGMSELEAVDEADRRLPRFVRSIDALISDRARRGLTVPYRWASSARQELLHVDYDEGAGPVSLQLQIRVAMLSAIHALTGRQFEHLCATLLGVYGIPSEDRDVTPPSREGGVDFVAVRRLMGPPGSERLARYPIRILGQAKRHSLPVQTDEMDAFCLRLTETRQHTGRAWERLPSWFQAASEPIVGLFITSNRYGDAARRSARQHTVFTLDGEQVADDLSRSSLTIDWLVPGTSQLDEDRFVATFSES